MGLDFTNIPDHEGAAVYILHSNNSLQESALQQLAKDITVRVAGVQVVMLAVGEPDTEKIREFYGLSNDSFPYVLIVRDSDELAGQWSGNDIPPADDIIYALGAVSGQ